MEYESAQDVYKKARGVICNIVWNDENKPFSLEEIHDALKEADAICRYDVYVPPSEFIRVLLEHDVLIFSDGFYKRSENWEENLKTIETFNPIRGHL